MESVEGKANTTNGESDELQSDRQKYAEDEEDGDNDEELIFPLAVDPAPTRAAAGGEGHTINAIDYKD